MALLFWVVIFRGLLCLKISEKMGYEVVISNSKLNLYGFRVLTSGIDTTQYARNPIMLWMHNRPWRGNKEEALPLGHLENVRVDGDDLKGTLVFDETDDFSKQIKAKWDAGTLRMVSPGIEPIERSDDPAYLVPGQRYATITKSRLTEVSVVDIGANDDALALYSAGKRITLSLDGNNDFLQPIKDNLNNVEMKTIALKLGLPETATEAEILAKIDGLQLAAGKVETLEKEANTQKETALMALVDNAIQLKKITADKKEHFVALGKAAGYDSLKATLELMTPAKKPNEVINLGSKKEVEEYKKLSEVPADEAIRLRAEDKETYAKLYKAEYGMEPTL